MTANECVELFDFQCDSCGSVLSVFARAGTLLVENCSDCIIEARDGGYQDGRCDGEMQGYDRGYSQGYNDAPGPPGDRADKIRDLFNIRNYAAFEIERLQREG